MIDIKRTWLIMAALFLLTGAVSASPVHVQPGDDLNDAMQYAHSNGYDSVVLAPGIYYIDSTLHLYGGVALRGTGTIKLVDDADWSYNGDYTPPMIAARSGESSDFVIEDITIDGNARGQSVSFGKGYYTMIEFKGVTGVKVNNVTMVDGNNDGLLVRRGQDISMTNCTVDKVGHDAGYFLRCTDVTFFNNKVFTRTNSACRISGGEDVTIAHNEIYSGTMNEGSSTGPGIEIDIDESGEYTDNINIYSNYIHDLRAAAMWITSGNRNGKGIRIYDNIIHDVGTYSSLNGRSNAAICIFQYEGTIIENNVFDDTGIAAIMHAQSTDHANNGQYSTIVRNNIFINIKNKIKTTTAEPIVNAYSKNHKFYVYNNDFFNNYDAFDGQEYVAWSNYELPPIFADSRYHLSALSELHGLGYNGLDIGAYPHGDEIIGNLDESTGYDYRDDQSGYNWLDNSTVDDDDTGGSVDNSTYDYDDDHNTDLDNSTWDDDQDDDGGEGELVDNSTIEHEDDSDDGYLDDSNNSELVDNSTTDVDNSTASTDRHHRSGKSYNLASYPSGQNTVQLIEANNRTKIMSVIVGIAYNTAPTFNYME